MEGRHDILRVLCIFACNKTIAVEQLDLRDIASSMGAKMILNVLFSCMKRYVSQIKSSRRELHNILIIVAGCPFVY